jgi:hypothetical protein
MWGCAQDAFYFGHTQLRAHNQDLTIALALGTPAAQPGGAQLGLEGVLLHVGVGLGAGCGVAVGLLRLT